MNLIKSIGIKYFRSIYHVRLKNINDLIILSGVNDVGKSNILKALNLFFNDETTWNKELEFEDDFSRRRLSEVRKESIKGKQFIQVSIEFNRPKTYKNSLPANFKVTRTWFRENFVTETNNLEPLSKKGKLPRSLNTAKRFLPIFLNRVHFEYVPAIKDKAYYYDLLSRLQDTILDIKTNLYPEISQLTEKLAPLIQDKIITLQDEFKRTSGIESAITPPDDFASLFQAFPVSTSLGDEHKIPLDLRGDGIQVKYLLSVLRYIFENSNDFFILGIEEPENSLEYSQVAWMAKDFTKIYPRKAQIFLTTHSPALISIREKNATCYRVYRADAEDISEVVEIWPKSDEKARGELNLEIGFMKLQEDIHKEYVKNLNEFNTLQSRVKILEKEIKETQRPLIVTEGKYDTKIMEFAWQKLNEGQECPYNFRPVDPADSAVDGGSGGWDSLKKFIETVHPADMRKAIAIFDRDTAGIKAFDKLSKNFKKWNVYDSIKVHNNGLAFAMLLPSPSERENYARNECLSIEFMFPDEVLKKRYVFSSPTSASTSLSY